MKFLVLLKKIFSEKKYQLAQKTIFRFLFFIFVFLSVDLTHEWYTQTYFGYAVRTSDGFINYLPYIFFGIFFILRLPQLSEINKTAVPDRFFWKYLVLALVCFLLPVNFTFFAAPLSLIFAQSLVLLVGYCFLFAGILGKNFITMFFTDLALLLLFIIPSHLAPLLIDHFWQYSSRVTLFGLSVLFHIFRIDANIVPAEFLVRVKDFSVIIGPSCAGIHSLTAFTILYAAILILVSQKRKLQLVPGALFYFGGLLCVFLLNSIRVLLIILVGVYYSQDVAINLFHKTIGSVLLLVFFLVYTSFVLPRIIKK